MYALVLSFFSPWAAAMNVSTSWAKCFHFSATSPSKLNGSDFRSPSAIIDCYIVRETRRCGFPLLLTPRTCIFRRRPTHVLKLILHYSHPFHTLVPQNTRDVSSLCSIETRLLGESKWWRPVCLVSLNILISSNGISSWKYRSGHLWCSTWKLVKAWKAYFLVAWSTMVKSLLKKFDSLYNSMVVKVF